MAGVARFDPDKGVVSATESYARSKAYATSATPKSGPVMNTMGSYVRDVKTKAS